MNYALQSIWHDRSRYLPGVLAVAFSAVLMSLQVGLLFGLFSVTSIPIDNSRADVWIGSPKVLSVDLGRPIPKDYASRAWSVPGVEKVESYYQAFGSWIKPNGGSELCIVIGMSLEEGSLGLNEKLTPSVQAMLTEPGGIVVDVSELRRLGLTGIGDVAEINGKQVRIVGLVEGMSSLAGPYVLSSLSTAADLLINKVILQNEVTYLLVKVSDPARAPEVVRQLCERYPKEMSSFTSPNFAYHSKKHWVTKTKAGIAIGYAALLGLLVGMVVTSQTLYAATTASSKEYATLLALGIPRSRISRTVLAQSFWVGIAGLIVAYPATLGFKEGAALLNVKVLLSPELVIGAACITMAMAMIAGMLALRSVMRLEPTTLLR